MNQFISQTLLKEVLWWSKQVPGCVAKMVEFRIFEAFRLFLGTQFPKAQVAGLSEEPFRVQSIKISLIIG